MSGDASKDAEIRELKRELARVIRRADIRTQIGYKRRPGSYGGKQPLVINNTLNRRLDVAAQDRAWVTDLQAAPVRCMGRVAEGRCLDV